MQLFFHLARLLVGCVFVFSGFVKGVDPLGFTYKIADYLTAFQMTWLVPAASVFAMFFILVEFAMGVSLVLRVRLREMLFTALAFLLFFTVLTLVIAFTNPVSDCGCFGDALILTNWQTFYKNLVLLLLVIFMIWCYQSEKHHKVYAAEWGWVVLSLAVMLFTSIHCYRHLPLFDFRPYHVGADIPAKMQLPAGVVPLETSTVLFYEKDGVVKEFTPNNFPWQDSTWVWKETRTVVLKENKAELHDFVLTDALTNQDVTDSVLKAGNAFLMVTYNLQKADDEDLIAANALAAWCAQHGMTFYALTSTGPDEIQKIKRRLKLTYHFATADEITLKTIVRDNPGYVVLNKGVVVDKWSSRDFPELETWSDQPAANAADRRRIMAEKRELWFYAGLFILIMIALSKHKNYLRKKYR